MAEREESANAAAREFAAVFQRNPLVVLSPENGDGATNLVVAPLDLLRVLVIHLRDLAPEGFLTFRPQPRCEVERHLVLA